MVSTVGKPNMKFHRSARLGVPPRVRARSPRALPGEKKKPCRLCARSLAASYAENSGRRVPSLGFLREAGVKPAQLSSLALRGTRNTGCEQPAGTALREQ